MRSPRIDPGLFGGFLAFLALSPGLVSADELSDEAIYKNIFKKGATQESVQISLPVFFEDTPFPLGTVNALAAQREGELRLDARETLALIDKLVVPDAKRPAADQKWLPLSAFAELGYSVLYNEKKLEIRIQVPAELRRSSVSSLSRMGFENQEITNQPEFFSTFTNIAASEGYQTSSTERSLQGRTPLGIQLQNGTNIGGVVLESSAIYTENKTGLPDFHSWARGDVRAVLDHPKLLLRQSVGDLLYPTVGFQQFTPMAGMSFTSQFGMEPSRLTVPTGETSVFLKRPSTVEIYVNRILQRTLKLPAGRHDLKDFPFTSGANDLKLVVTDDLGQIETIEKPFFSSTELLRPGLHQVSYNAGIPSNSTTGIRQYNPNQKSFSVYHRLGLSQTTTLGLNMQNDSSGMLLGAESAFALPIGYLSFEPAMSNGTARSNGYALRGRYRYSDLRGKNRSQRSLSLQITGKTSEFGSPFLTEISNTTRWDIQTSYSQALAARVNGTFSFGYQIASGGDPSFSDGYHFSFSLGRQWIRGPNVNALFNQAQYPTGLTEGTIAINLTWQFTKEHQYINMGYNAKNDATQLAWAYTPAEAVGGTSARANIQKENVGRRASAEIFYTGNRETLTVAHDSGWDSATNSSTGLTNVSLNTALLFTRWKFALSRPITDSFVIISGEKNLKNQVIEANGQNQGDALGSSDWLGPAALPDLPSYGFYPVLINQQRFPLGVTIDQDRFGLYPAYKSGYLIKLGADATYSVGMKLLGSDGAPISAQAGTVTSLGDSTFEPLTVFSSRSGKLQAAGLKPGKYLLTLFNEALNAVPFEVPENASSYALDLGNINVGSTPRKTE